MKTKRQQEILDIIAKEEIETQEQLLERLRERGINTTQATISRDIKQLHLVKEGTPGGLYKYAVAQRKSAHNFTERLKAILREGVAFDVAQNIAVAKTMPGMANALAAAVDDGMDIPDMVGSLAGDDTIIFIMRTNEAAHDFCEEMRSMLH